MRTTAGQSEKKLFENETTNHYLSFRLKSSLKDAFSEFCDGCGITTSDAVFMLVKRVIRIKEVPFKVEPFYMYGSLDKSGHRVKNEQMTIRMEPELLEEFESVCNDIGVSKSAMMKMYFIRCLNDNCLPFWGN